MQRTALPTATAKLGYCRRHESLALAGLPPDAMDALLEQVASLIEPDDETGCCLWAGSVDESGYAHCFVDGCDWLVHRLM